MSVNCIYIYKYIHFMESAISFPIQMADLFGSINNEQKTKDTGNSKKWYHNQMKTNVLCWATKKNDCEMLVVATVATSLFLPSILDIISHFIFFAVLFSLALSLSLCFSVFLFVLSTGLVVGSCFYIIRFSSFLILVLFVFPTKRFNYPDLIPNNMCSIFRFFEL